MRLLVITALLASFSAQAAPASEESVETLLAVTNSKAVMETVFSSMDQMMRQGMQQSLQGKPITEKQRRMLDAVPAKFVAVMREEMSWEKMRPMYVKIYRETFEQHEIDGMLAFYATPAGKALINKMPVVMQKSMAVSQSMLRSFIPKMRAAMEEAMDEARVNGNK